MCDFFDKRGYLRYQPTHPQFLDSLRRRAKVSFRTYSHYQPSCWNQSIFLYSPPTQQHSFLRDLSPLQPYCTGDLRGTPTFPRHLIQNGYPFPRVGKILFRLVLYACTYHGHGQNVYASLEPANLVPASFVKIIEEVRHEGRRDNKQQGK